MKRQLPIFLIIVFALGLTTINLNNQSAQASSGMIAHWNFDEGSGTTLNDTVGGRDGVITGAVWTTGFRGNALSFDGVDDYVLTENVPILNAYTISFVVKSGGAVPVVGLYPRIINTPANRADMALVNGDKVYYNIKGDAFHDSLCTASTDAWSFITMTYDGLTRKFYQNGVLKHANNVSGADLVGPNSQPGGLSFARNSSYGSNDSYAKIYLDDVKLYDGVLSSSEILAEYENRECTQDLWGCGDWGECQSNGQQTRSCAITKECSFVNTPSPTIQSCTYIPPVCTSWTYSGWGTCSTGGQQTRTILSSSPLGCVGGSPILNQSCTPPNPKIISLSPSPVYVTKSGTELTIYGEGFRKFEDCSGILVGDGNKIDVLSWSDTKIIAKLIKNKPLGIGQHQLVVKSCGESPSFPLLVKQAVCDTEEDWACTGWGTCSIDGMKIRTCTQEFACDSIGTPPATTQTCTPSCTKDIWDCENWNTCSSYGQQTRVCTKIFDCSTANTPSPITLQNCTPPKQQQPVTPTQPTCSEDTWQCGDWNSCSPNGIQTRSCKRTYDCPSEETPPPATSQYCQSQAPSYSNNTPSGGGSSAQSNNTINEGINQDAIIQATVQLACLINKTSAIWGSGTVIDPKGIILTNRHVVEGTKGCVVGFINNSDDDPSFTEVADIVKLSNDEDIALIKIRNDGSKTFVYSDISSGSVNSKNLGNKIMIFGYPSIGGAKLTYSDGAVSGFGSTKDGLGNYLKTTAFIEHGNSGGGAYLMNNNFFIGIPSAGIRGELASIGYILSVNKIKSWMNGSGLAYSGSGFSNLSSKSIKASALLENVDMSTINIIDVSSANVSIYSSKTKTTLLPNNPGTIQIYNRPAFQINNVDKESGVVGYYVYFGTNMKADPVKKGKLIKKSEYVPLTITQKGVYYFIFRAKNKNGNISEAVITEYRYKK